ncbi:MAG: nucleoside hydrolase [Chloroflexota bacterium]|nr:nucleoside hydrolase [Chloroflexota bacterium]
MPLPVYLDVDTGVDDALAILLATLHPALEVRGITTVVGNVDLEQVTRNTLQVLEVAGAGHVPVVSGADRPLVAPAHPAAVVHGEDGLGGANLPPPRREPAGNDAVAFLRRELLAAERPVGLIALAPLTNIALLFQVAPEVKPKVRELALMGGAVSVGNASPVAEFNIFHDPEAADIVFRSGVPILMYGLEVFRQVCFSAEETDRWFASSSALASAPSPNTVPVLAGHLLHFMMRNFNRPEATIGDAGCVACVIDRSGLTTERLPVYVETGGRHCRGQTVVDRRPRALIERRPIDEEAYEADVALDINADLYRDLFRRVIGREAQRE